MIIAAAFCGVWMRFLASCGRSCPMCQKYTHLKNFREKFKLQSKIRVIEQALFPPQGAASGIATIFVLRFQPGIVRCGCSDFVESCPILLEAPLAPSGIMFALTLDAVQTHLLARLSLRRPILQLRSSPVPDTQGWTIHISQALHTLADPSSLSSMEVAACFPRPNPVCLLAAWVGAVCHIGADATRAA